MEYAIVCSGDKNKEISSIGKRLVKLVEDGESFHLLFGLLDEA